MIRKFKKLVIGPGCDTRDVHATTASGQYLKLLKVEGISNPEICARIQTASGYRTRSFATATERPNVLKLKYVFNLTFK